MIYKCQICSMKPLTAWVILKWSLFRMCWTLIYKHRIFEIFICGIFLDDICFCATSLNICECLNESPTSIVRVWIKAIGKESSSVRVHFVSCQNFCLWVFTLHRKMKKGKDEMICVERLSLIINHLWKNIDKKRWNKTSFFPEKISSLKKTSQRLKWKHFAS